MRKQKLFATLLASMVAIYAALPLSCCSSLHTAWADQEPQLTQSVYLEPWLVFQAGIQEKLGYYLLAFNTNTGELIPINQGYHRDFWLHDDTLYFFHAGRYFACPWAQWDQAQQMPQPPEAEVMENRLATLSKDIPSILQVLELDDIHAVVRGSFTFPARNELLFISGQQKGYDLAVYSHTRDVLKLETHEHVAFEMPGHDFLNRPMFFFREALAQDFDRDGCLELVINGTFTAWDYPGDALLYIDFSRPQSGEIFQLIDLPRSKQEKPLQSPRLIRHGHHKVQVQFGLPCIFEVKEVDYYDFILDSDGFIQLRYDQTEIFNLFPQEKTPHHQDFYSSIESLQSAPPKPSLSSTLHPELAFPILYKENPDMLLEQRIYHRKRNQAVLKWMKQLEEEWNPFDGINKISESLEDPAILLSQWAHWVDLIPVRVDPGVYFYAVPHLFQSSHPTLNLMVMLYDNALKLIDVWCPRQDNYILGDPRVFPSKNSTSQHEYVRLLLPSPGERTLVFLFPDQGTASSYQAIGVSRFGFFSKYRHQGFVWRYLAHSSGYKLEAIKTHNISDPWGYGSSFTLSFLCQFDPIDGQGQHQLFSYRYQEHLQELYRWLSFHYSGAMANETATASIHPFIAVIEAYEALLFHQDASQLEDLCNIIHTN